MSTITPHAARAVQAGPRITPLPRASVGRVTPRMVWALAAVALLASLALAAAKQLAVNFVTVDYQHVDADTARVKGGATGDFLKSYSSSMADLKKVLVANKTVSSVERTEAAIVSGDRDSAVALVGVVAPTKNTAVPNGETKTYRMRLELRTVGDEWKVENLEFVG
jgi:Mce-associated membrane protein